MQLKDTKLGDTITVYLGAHGDLCRNIIRGVKDQFPLKATIVGTAGHGGFNTHVMLGFDNTVSCVPNRVERDIVAHTTPGYAFLTDFHKTYRWTVWEENDLECDPISAKSTTASVKLVFPDDKCKCGIHLTLHPCDYHPYSP
jgi:hypothetical protein